MQIELEGAEAVAWADAHARALEALRLNKQFPPWRQLAETGRALAMSGQLRLDPATGLLAGREWVRARADRDLAPETLARFADLDVDGLPSEEAQRLRQKRDYLKALCEGQPPASRQVEVALRHRDKDRASYRVIVDRIDLGSGTTARYTLLMWDTEGRRISRGDLELVAHDDFAHKLALLTTQDAALAFAVLREQELGVEEIVRGVIGPAVLPGRTGPDELQRASAPMVSACLERVSLDLEHGHLDDPIPRPVTVPASGVDFGMSMQRKWAAADADLPLLRAWLAARGSRNLAYGY
jgi:hypothetical protein